jgi:hypothetical protein
MVVVKYSDGISYYMDRRIKGNLEKLKNRLVRKDSDFVLVIDGPEGSGKCQPAGSKVMMADGSYKNIEDINMGDRIISPQIDGTHIFANVINLFKFKAKNIYKVYELNREKKELYSCSDNHIIPLYTKYRPRINGNKLKENSYWVAKHYPAEKLYEHKPNFFKNTTTPTCFKIDKFEGRKDCKIEPYTLGVYLGDGSFHSTRPLSSYYKGKGTGKARGYFKNLKGQRIWVRSYERKYTTSYGHLGYQLSRALNITSNHFEILEEISKFYPIMSIYQKKDTTAKSYRFSLNGELSKLLSEYGLEGKGSGEKFIPQEALYSNSEYRKRLLAGLIDTDGTLSNSCSYSITTKSEQMAKNILFLVYSLGGRGRIIPIKKKIKKINFEGSYFTISFYFGTPEIPLKVKYKIKPISRPGYISANRISIRLEKKEGDIVYGFELDSPSHWYVTDNFVVTHQSVLAMQIGKYMEPNLNEDDVCMTAGEFVGRIMETNRRVVIYDEAFTGLSSRKSLTDINNDLVSLMMEMRQKNLFVIIVLPTFFMLDRYVALFRARGLIHVYTRKNGKRGYYLFFNSHKKKLLYIWGKKLMSYRRPTTNFKGRFFDTYGISEKDYRKKKKKALENKERLSKSEKFLRQRNVLVYAIWDKFKKTAKEISELIKEYSEDSISSEQVKDLIAKSHESITRKRALEGLNPAEIAKKYEAQGILDPSNVESIAKDKRFLDLIARTEGKKKKELPPDLKEEYEKITKRNPEFAKLGVKIAKQEEEVKLKAARKYAEANKNVDLLTLEEKKVAKVHDFFAEGVATKQEIEVNPNETYEDHFYFEDNKPDNSKRETKKPNIPRNEAEIEEKAQKEAKTDEKALEEAKIEEKSSKETKNLRKPTKETEI